MSAAPVANQTWELASDELGRQELQGVFPRPVNGDAKWVARYGSLLGLTRVLLISHIQYVLQYMYLRRTYCNTT